MEKNSVNVAEAKEHLSDLLGRVAYGKEIITITRRGKPMARLVPIRSGEKKLHIADARGWLEDRDKYFHALDAIIADRKNIFPAH